MLILTVALGWLAEFAINTIEFLGYPGIIILMALESMIFPIPSELVMPFAGFLAGQGRFQAVWVVVASSIGSGIGSLLSYYLGKYGGNKVVLRWGKYLLLDEIDLQKTEQWFARRGERIILISRFIPVVRHLISIPAGIGKMPLGKFMFYTIIGATAWNGFLTSVGYVLGQRWEEVRHYTEPLSIAVGLFLLLAMVYIVRRHWKHKHQLHQEP